MSDILAQKKQFHSPLDIPLFLSGSFGDVRLNHFHTGYDLRTKSQIGKNVFATDDGIISRVKIEPSGYGKAIYIDHANGLTTVYAHLESFVLPIEEVIKNEQYKQKSFSVDFTPSQKIKVKKGELIAFSGNTGGSGGPHLHFEIRKTKNQNPINPYPFKFKLMDDFNPKFDAVYLYPLNGGTINNQVKRVKINVNQINNKKWVVKLKKPLIIKGNFGIGIEAGSKSNSGFYHGLTHIELSLNGKQIYSFNLDEFSYNETRFANSVTDYNERLQSGTRIYKLFVDPCNTLTNTHSINNGIIHQTDSTFSSNVIINISDFKGNKSTLNFPIKVKKEEKINKKKAKFELTNDSTVKQINCKTNYSIELDSFNMFIPKGSVYSNFPADFKIEPASQSTISSIYTFNNEYIPIHSPISIKIKPLSAYNHLLNKMILVNVWEKGKLTSLGGTYSNEWISCSTRNFGSFAIAIDTISPTINAVTLSNTTDLSDYDNITFTIQDNISGINTINGYIDDRWVLFEYDPKTKRIFYQFDPIRLTYGKNHLLKIILSDKCNNTTTYNSIFFK